MMKVPGEMRGREHADMCLNLPDGAAKNGFQVAAGVVDID
jgi:hypothetical protein